LRVANKKEIKCLLLNKVKSKAILATGRGGP
jgi:hypothetical protein